jgi:outer membrane protein assembly factor BamB
MRQTCTVLIGLIAACTAQGDEWRGFRGDGRSIATDAQVPVKWSIETGENIAWQIDLPGRGVSGPIIADGRIIVTCSSGPREERLHVVAYEPKSGRELWHRQFWATGRTITDPTSAVAANTPVTDGKRVYAYFSSNDLVALDLDGNVQWIRGLQFNHPLAGNDFGQASSPAVVGDAVVVQSEGQGEAFVAAFDVGSGALKWQHERPKKAGWSSPVPIRQEIDGKPVDATVVMSLDGFDVFESDAGERIWGQAVACNAMPSPVVDGESIFVPAQGLSQFQYDPGTQAATNPWKISQLQVGNSSPVIYRNRAYVLGNSGVLACSVVGSDKVDWRLRLGGSFWATPVAVGDRMYCINDSGKAFVVELGEKGKIAAENDFDEEILASPAVADDAMYVRGYKRLWKIAEKPSESAAIDPPGGSVDKPSAGG